MHHAHRYSLIGWKVIFVWSCKLLLNTYQDKPSLARHVCHLLQQIQLKSDFWFPLCKSATTNTGRGSLKWDKLVQHKQHTIRQTVTYSPRQVGKPNKLGPRKSQTTCEIWHRLLYTKMHMIQSTWSKGKITEIRNPNVCNQTTKGENGNKKTHIPAQQTLIMAPKRDFSIMFHLFPCGPSLSQITTYGFCFLDAASFVNTLRYPPVLM